MKFDIRDYMWEIFQISTYNHTRNIKVAFELFLTNVELKQNRYKGCPKISYKKLGNVWNNLDDLSKEYQKIVFEIIIRRSYYNLYSKFEKGQRGQFEDLCQIGRYLESYANESTW